MEPSRLRDARDDDADALIELIARIWDEYPGCVMDVDGEVPELRRIASHHVGLAGEFWVAERDGRIVGCVGWTPAGRGVELCKLYVAAPARRTGLAARLCEKVERAARGHAFVELWSDTRFEDAHRLYEKRGYVRGPHTRELHDLSHTVEYYYRLELVGSPP
jgi:putative acetyltransferase